MKKKWRAIIDDERNKRIMIPAGIVFVTLLVGTVGYTILWRNYQTSYVDALYMTVITLTTLGYGEIHPLDSTGRIFTMFIAVTGIGSLFYMFGVVMEQLVISQISNSKGRKKMEKSISELSNHIILAGLGRVGRLAAQELIRSRQKFVVIESNEANTSFAENNNIPYVIGDATEDQILAKAGIERACGLIVAAGIDATNVFIVLTARVLNPKLFIAARAEDESNIAKLMLAGADRAIDPYAIGGQHLANLVIHPQAVEFVQMAISQRNEHFSIEYIPVQKKSKISGMKIKDIRKSYSIATLILAILRGKNSTINPDSDFEIHENDELVVFGNKKQLSELEAITKS